MNWETKYSQIYQITPISKMDRDSINLSNDNSRHHDEAVNRIALALYDIRKYGDFVEAKNVAEKMLDFVEEQPPVRVDKVELAKRRVKSGYYFHQEIVEKTAEKMLDAMGF